MNRKSKNESHQSPHPRTVEGVLADLKSRQMRLTQPRRAIIQGLIDKHGPFTVEEVHRLFTKHMCDLATVYRCLTSLEEIGILRRVEFGDKASRYELADPHGAHHHHLICNACKRVEVVDDPEIEEIGRFAKKRGYTNVSHLLEFFGTCPACQ